MRYYPASRWNYSIPRVCRQKSGRTCSRHSARSTTATIRDTGWVFRSCTRSSKNWAARGVWKAKWARAVYFSSPCQPIPLQKLPVKVKPSFFTSPKWRRKSLPDRWMRPGRLCYMIIYRCIRASLARPACKFKKGIQHHAGYQWVIAARIGSQISPPV